MERRIATWALLGLVLPGIGALQVNTGKAEYEYARGDNITIPCSFTLKTPGSNPSLGVFTWSVKELQANAKEIAVLTHFYPTGKTDIKNQYEGRVSIDFDIRRGKADLKLSSITLADNKNFECRVLIPGDDEGKPASTTRLVVLVAPSVPICAIQGKAEYGQNINLTCASQEGSPPPTYKWESRDVRNTPRIPDRRTTDRGGVMSLFNISRETSGYYICTSSNKIRSASCNITLAVNPPSMNIGSTAGIIIAAVIISLIILGIIIYCCCCRKKNKEEEYAMGVREEAYHDKEPDTNGEGRHTDRQEIKLSYEESEVRSSGDQRDQYDERSERGHDRRNDYDDRRSDYDDRRSDYDDRRSDYDDRRSDYNDRRDKYSDRNERYDDDRRYDDERRYEDSRDRRYDDEGRYDERYDDRDRDRPPVPANKPARSDYDD